jgi:hypothetical protein
MNAQCKTTEMRKARQCWQYNYTNNYVNKNSLMVVSKKPLVERSIANEKG